MSTMAGIASTVHQDSTMPNATMTPRKQVAAAVARSVIAATSPTARSATVMGVVSIDWYTCSNRSRNHTPPTASLKAAFIAAVASSAGATNAAYVVPGGPDPGGRLTSWPMPTPMDIR
jgi:hypothetical protein